MSAHRPQRLQRRPTRLQDRGWFKVPVVVLVWAMTTAFGATPLWSQTGNPSTDPVSPVQLPPGSEAQFQSNPWYTPGATRLPPSPTGRWAPAPAPNVPPSLLAEEQRQAERAMVLPASGLETPQGRLARRPNPTNEAGPRRRAAMPVLSAQQDDPRPAPNDPLSLDDLRDSSEPTRAPVLWESTPADAPAGGSSILQMRPDQPELPMYPSSPPAYPPQGWHSDAPANVNPLPLELPSHLNPSGTCLDTESQASRSGTPFWDQFPTMPPEDARKRTEGYDSLPAILANGFWFGGVDVMMLEPIFANNNVLVNTDGNVQSGIPADFNFDPALRGYFGFETHAGPAVKFAWTRYSEFSAPASFVSDGARTAVSTVDVGTPGGLFQLAATAAGDRLVARQQIKMMLTDVLFYKDQKNPVSRVRGNVGLRYLNLQQFYFGELQRAAGGVARVRSSNDVIALGPRLGIEYMRPVGHTDLEIQAGLFGSLLFGRRDHIVSDTAGANFVQLGTSEPIGMFELHLGVQWNRALSPCQHAFVRAAMESQYWMNADAPAQANSDLGFYGFTIGAGLTR